jgi:hypothetical protein
MKKWFIEDGKVRALLVKNGCVCEKYKATPMVSGRGIHINTRTQEQIEKEQWYVTDCPVKWNEQYTLPDGSIIRSHGTNLVLMSTEEE